LEKLNPNIEMVPRFLDNTERLLTECGPVAKILLETNHCKSIVITWDLEPAWDKSQKVCLHDDREKAIKSLRDSNVLMSKAVLLCIVRELECWLMADKRALQTVIGDFKHPHPVGQIREFKKPDTQIGRPKTELIKLFQRELGKTRKYVDRNHALLLAQSILDWSKLRRSDSFRRFAEKAACVSLP